MCTERNVVEEHTGDNSMRVSIIVPVYNSVKYIRRCIESILTQTYKNYELILVDDGSSDLSGAICDDYSYNNARIKVLHKENGGQNRARYEGLKEASSEYVMFIDSDDWVDCDYVEQLIRIMNNEDVDLVTSGLIFEKKDFSTYFFDGVDEGIYNHKEIYEHIVDRYLYDSISGGQGITHSLSNKLIRKGILMPIISNIDKRITICEDGAVIFSILLEATKIKVSHYCGYHYIQHNDSAIHSYNHNELWRINLLKEYYIEQFYKYGIDNILLMKGLLKFIGLNAEKALAHSLGYEKEYSLAVPSQIPGAAKKVIVYGAGVKGKEFVEDLELDSRFSIVAWADRIHKLKVHKKIELISIESILDMEFDCIFIAIMNRFIAKEVENELVDMGISSKKIWIAQIEEKYVPI